MNTWGGFVEYNFKESGGAASAAANSEPDNGQLPHQFQNLGNSKSKTDHLVVSPDIPQSGTNYVDQLDVPSQLFPAGSLPNSNTDASATNSAGYFRQKFSQNGKFDANGEKSDGFQVEHSSGSFNESLDGIAFLDSLSVVNGHKTDYEDSPLPQIIVTPAAPVEPAPANPKGLKETMLEGEIDNSAFPTTLPLSLPLLATASDSPPVYFCASATSPESEHSPTRTSNRKSPSKRRRDSEGEKYSSGESSPSSNYKHKSRYQRHSDADTEGSRSYPCSEHEGGISGWNSETLEDMVTSDASIDLRGLDDGLFSQYPNQVGDFELCILSQPEANHRARYRTEGSRGCVKDRTGTSCPTVQLRGRTRNESAVLQVFAGNESGYVQPHHLYRVSRAGGKKTTPCREMVSEGVNILEMDLDFSNNSTVKVDCLGIMKFRNTDIKSSQDSPARSSQSKRPKRSRKLRLIFQAVITHSDGQTTILRTVSTPISCTALPGVPEIHHLSHQGGDATGGSPLVVIGRNFMKNESKLFIIEKSAHGDEKITWEREIPLMLEHFQAVHMVGVIPPYHNPHIFQPVRVFVVVHNKGKQSEPYAFSYMPSIALDTETSALMPAPVAQSSQAILALEMPVTLSPLQSSYFPVSLSDANIQLSVQPDHNNPAGHLIIITVPSVSCASSPLQSDPSSSSEFLKPQISPIQNGHCGRMNGKERFSNVKALENGVLDLFKNSEKSNQQLFDELLQDIMNKPLEGADAAVNEATNAELLEINNRLQDVCGLFGDQLGNFADV